MVSIFGRSFARIATELGICKSELRSCELRHATAHIDIRFRRVNGHSPVRHALELWTQSRPSVREVGKEEDDDNADANSNAVSLFVSKRSATLTGSSLNIRSLDNVEPLPCAHAPCVIETAQNACGNQTAKCTGYQGPGEEDGHA